MDAGKTRYRSIVDRERRDALVTDHLDLVRHVLGRLLMTLPGHVDRDNLEGAGLLGLVEAAASYDSTRGCDFRTFATLRIRGEIIDELRRNCAIPQPLLQRWRRIQEAFRTLGQDASSERVAAETGLTSVEITECEQAIRLERSGHGDALDSIIDYHTLSDDLHQSRVDCQETRLAVANAIEKLPEVQRTAVSLYYMDELRLREIGQVLNLSEARVCRILQAAEETIRRELRLQEFID